MRLCIKILSKSWVVLSLVCSGFLKLDYSFFETFGFLNFVNYFNFRPKENQNLIVAIIFLIRANQVKTISL